MTDSSDLLLVITIFLSLAFAYSNGINDAANAIATVVSTRALRASHAVMLGATMNFLGALTGSAVAATIGSKVVRPEFATETTALGAIGAAVLWVFTATRYGIPVSVSHSLFAGLVGAGIASGGFDAIVASSAIKIVMALAASPILGFIGGLLLMHIIYWTFRRNAYSTVNAIFGRLQVLSAGWAAYAHGKNDGQNAAGIITFALAVHAGTMAADVSVPFWAIAVSALTIGMGTALGGWKVIQTLGMRVTKLTHVHGFSANTSAGSVIELASLFGLPVSTTHTITGSIMGVGATERLSAVRWGVTRRIMAAWMISYPVCFALGFTMVKGFDLVL
jgi:PiT family inorganic phosphate transporter